MFAKDKVSQSLIDAVNKVLAVESKSPEQLNEAFPTVADAKKRMNEPKPSGGSGIKLGTRYGGGRQADEPEKDEDEPKKREKYGARKTRFTNTKLYKEADDCVDKDDAKDIAKKEVDKHEGGMHGKKGEVAKHVKSMHKEELKGKQHKIDANKNGKIDAHDFELLRSKKKKMTEGLAFAEHLIESMYGKKSALPIDEKEMSDAQKKKKEDIVMSMKKDTAGLKKRYGSRWKEVMYATATKRAMGETYGEEVEIDEAKKPMTQDEKDRVTAGLRAAMKKSYDNEMKGRAALETAKAVAKAMASAHKAKKTNEEVEEFEEEIDPNVRTKDALSGGNKPTKQKDDTGPGSDGRSTKVKFRGGPMDEEKENEKEDEGHEDEKEDKALVKKLVKKDALKEDEQLDELSKDTLSSYLQKRGSMVSPRSKNNKGNENMAKAVSKIAKKTNEEVEQIDEISKKTVKSYLSKTVDPVYGIPKSKEKLSQRMKGISAAHQRIVGNKPTSEEVELDESHMDKPKKLKSFMSMKKEMIGKAGMTSEKKDEE